LGHGILETASPSAERSPFVSGFLEIAPILIGVFPFGLIAGIAAVEAGLGSVQAYSLSPIVFAGASQLAMADLIGRDAAPIVIVATALVINARFAMYSASLAPAFRELGPIRKGIAAYILTDQSFAVSVVRFDQREERLRDRFAFYMGASLGLWATWQISSVIGVVVGAGMPEDWSLDFAIPLVFIALLFPAIKDPPQSRVAGRGCSRHRSRIGR
jgi:4-azaleucine resistance transporter AzlC